MSKFSSLSKKRSQSCSIQSVISFGKDISKFEAIFEELESSDHVSDPQFEYLKMKLAKKNQWGKCFINKSFGGGVSTTSQVEGLHSTRKKYLTSSSSLKEVFYFFRKLEKIKISKFVEEFNIKSSNNIDDIVS